MFETVSSWALVQSCKDLVGLDVLVFVYLYVWGLGVSVQLSRNHRLGIARVKSRGIAGVERGKMGESGEV